MHQFQSWLQCAKLTLWLLFVLYVKRDPHNVFAGLILEMTNPAHYKVSPTHKSVVCAGMKSRIVCVISHHMTSIWIRGFVCGACWLTREIRCVHQQKPKNWIQPQAHQNYLKKNLVLGGGFSGVFNTTMYQHAKWWTLLQNQISRFTPSNAENQFFWNPEKVRSSLQIWSSLNQLRELLDFYPFPKTRRATGWNRW